jgi:Ice-binding-like
MPTDNTCSRRDGAALIAFGIAAAVVFMFGTTASAAIVPTVPLGTSANYAVLGGSTVTNTGNSVLNGSLGLSPGTSITGFPPGLVNPPGTTDATNAAAAQAQSDLTAAYVNAAGRSISATTTADLANKTLQAGVYSGPSKGALSLSGPLTLDGAGNANSVFIFQTDSTLITGSGSTVRLINGAQECNVFWQVGSSATLGTGSVFVGNILALSSITVNNSVTVHGRALARNAAVTLNNDTFTKPTCATSTTTTTVPTAPPASPVSGTAKFTG